MTSNGNWRVIANKLEKRMPLNIEYIIKEDNNKLINWVLTNLPMVQLSFHQVI